MVEYLLASLKAMNSIRNFIEKGEFYHLLSEVGKCEFKSAIDALGEIGLSKDKKLVITRVLTHLESSKNIYYEILMNNRTILDINICDHAKRIIFFSNCLMALCHVYLGDDSKLIYMKLNNAEYMIDFYPDTDNLSFKDALRHSAGLAGLSIIAPFLIVGILISNADENDELSRDGYVNKKFFDLYKSKLISLYTST